MGQLVSGKVYNEVFEVLKVKKKVMEKIPKEDLEHIYRFAHNSGYQFHYDPEKDILNQISNDAFCLYLSLYLEHVATEEEKEELKKILIENEIRSKNQI